MIDGIHTLLMNMMERHSTPLNTAALQMKVRFNSILHINNPMTKRANRLSKSVSSHVLWIIQFFNCDGSADTIPQSVSAQCCHFVATRVSEIAQTRITQGFIASYFLLPLNRPWWFGGYIVDHPVHLINLVDDPPRNPP